MGGKTDAKLKRPHLSSFSGHTIAIAIFCCQLAIVVIASKHTQAHTHPHTLMPTHNDWHTHTPTHTEAETETGVHM